MRRISLGTALAAVVSLAVAGVWSSCAASVTDLVVAVTSDYSVSGSVSTIDVIPPWSVDTGVASVHSDAVGREHNGLVYVVNKLYADNIQVLDPEDAFSTVRQFSVGPGSNPQDIAFVSDTRAYVSRYESVWMLEVDPTTGAVTDSIDLSSFADLDGTPEMAGVAYAGGYVFVAIQRIDRDVYWTPVPPSYLAVIDPVTNALVDVDPDTPGTQSIELEATNPYGELLVDGSSGLLFVPESGDWGALDGGVEIIDPATLTSLGFATTEAALGGDINDVTLDVGGRAHATISVASPSWESYVVAWDVSSGALLEEVYRPGGWSVADIEVHAGSAQLFVSDRTYTEPGVRVFDAVSGDEKTTAPIFTGLPPHDLVLLGSDVTHVTAGLGGRALLAWPNPTMEGVSFALSSVPVADAAVKVFDVAGRLVAELPVPTGRAECRWNGRDELGHRVASGVYFARTDGEAGSSCGGGGASARFVVLR